MRKALLLFGLVSGAASWTGWAQTELHLLSFTNVWRYYQAGNAPPGNWTAPDYDDSSWSSGPGPFGFPEDENLLGCGRVRTVLPRYLADGTTQIITYYFRTTFDYPSHVSPGTTLVLSGLVDDGCVIYLNGAELARIGMATGTPTYDTLATRSVELSLQGLDLVTLTPTNLLRGLNTLAVEVHQNSSSSSDLIFGAHLNAVICSEPRIIGCPPDLTVSAGSALSIQMTVNSGGCASTYRWYKGVPGNATLLPAVTTSQLYYPSASPTHTGSYFLVASNVAGAATSCVVNVEVVPDTFPPGIVLAVADDFGASNSIRVIFTENLLRASATNVANYSLTLLGTTNPVLITNASHWTKEVTLRVDGSNWVWGSNYVLTVHGVCDLRTNCLTCCSNRVRVAFWRDLFPYEGMSKVYNTLWARDILRTNYVFWDQSWTMPDYDDSDPNLWLTGTGGAYYFDPDPTAEPCVALRTDIGPRCPDVLTYYFRTRFVAPTNTGRGLLQVSYLLDDGAIFYVNGMEIGRVNMPEGLVTPLTPATAEAEASCGSLTTNVMLADLRSGVNLLAAEVHQMPGLGAADLYYAVRIRAAIDESLVEEPPNPPILQITRVTAAGAPTNTVANTHVQVSWDSTNAPDWRLYMASDVTGPWTLVATNPPFRTEVTPQAARFFTLRQP